VQSGAGQACTVAAWYRFGKCLEARDHQPACPQRERDGGCRRSPRPDGPEPRPPPSIPAHAHMAGRPSGAFGGRLGLEGLVGTYEAGLAHLGSAERPCLGHGDGSRQEEREQGERPGKEGEEEGEDGPRLFLWLGSSIGNMARADAAAFLRRLRDEAMRPGAHAWEWGRGCLLRRAAAPGGRFLHMREITRAGRDSQVQGRLRLKC
jgi:hypothetical protein